MVTLTWEKRNHDDDGKGSERERARKRKSSASGVYLFVSVGSECVYIRIVRDREILEGGEKE